MDVGSVEWSEVFDDQPEYEKLLVGPDPPGVPAHVVKQLRAQRNEDQLLQVLDEVAVHTEREPRRPPLSFDPVLPRTVPRVGQRFGNGTRSLSLPDGDLDRGSLTLRPTQYRLETRSQRGK